MEIRSLRGDIDVWRRPYIRDGQHKRVARLPVDRPKKISAGHAFREIAESLSHPAALILLSGALLMFASQGIIFCDQQLSVYIYLAIFADSVRAISATAASKRRVRFPIGNADYAAVWQTADGGLRQPSQLGFPDNTADLLLLKFWPAIGSTPSTSLVLLSPLVQTLPESPL